MLERPNLDDNQILTCLNASFGIQAQTISFLPIGNDSNAWVYRIEAHTNDYFLKVRKGTVNLAVLKTPHYLQESGIKNVIAPIASQSGELYVPLQNFSLILYPWIHSETTSAWDVTLSDDQWQSWGNIMRTIHQTPIPDDLSQLIPTETFVCKWNDIFNRVNALIQTSTFNNTIQQQTANFWRTNQPTINHIYRRQQNLGTQLQAQAHTFVICHADIHKANIMIDKHDEIHIVDWDEVIIAPIERDLMFFVSDGHDPHKVNAFLRGYGDMEVNHTALAYYRYEWVIQEFGDYGERIFLNDDLSDVEKQSAFHEFKQLFDAGDVIDLAFQADEF